MRWPAGNRVSAASRRLLALLALLACGAAAACDRPASRPADGVSAGASSAAVADSLVLAPAQPGETSRLPQSPPDALGAFRLAGNEPFWGVRIDGAGLTFTTPDYPNGILFPSVAPSAQGTTLRWVAITPPPDAHTLDVTLEARPCQDTMADRTWTHVAQVIFDGTTLSGCGERAQASAR